MGRITVVSCVTIYEIGDEEQITTDHAILTVSSHQNEGCVVLETHEGARLMVVGKDLKTAIDNAMNTG